MAFPIRSLTDISRAIRGAVRQYLPGTDASLRQNVLYVIAKVMALLSHEYELRLAWIFRQLFLSTATSENMVRMHAAEYGIARRPAGFASGEIVGIGSPNIIYPAGIRFVSAGTTFVTTGGFQADALGAYQARVQAENAGAAGNRDAEAVLVLADPGLFPTLRSEASVGPAGLGGGADAETMEQLRARALKRKREPPQGGALSDYERWALEVPGVAAVWARQARDGFGTVGAWLLFTGRTNGLATAEDLAAVDAYIKDKRLVRARFYATTPKGYAVPITLALSPDTVATRAATLVALRDFFDARLPGSRVRPGLPGEAFTLPLAWLSEAISGVAGEDAHTLIEPSGNLVFQPGTMPVLGAVTWA